MRDEGADLVMHYRDLAFMGFIEVLLNLRTILKNIKFCKKDIEAFNPDVVIFIDYPGFNMRIAEWAKQVGYKTAYYISPQIWAWKQSRVHQIKRTIDHMFVILPFEVDFYARFNFPVTFVGHPLLDAVEQYEKEKPSFESYIKEHNLSNKPIIALLPGSRKQEINTILPIMLKSLKSFTRYQFVVAGAPSRDTEFYKPFLQKQNVHLIENQTYELLQQSTAALVTSGTATLEAALFNVPQVVCYKGSFISYHIAKRLVKVNYISLVNLIMNGEVVKELIQIECNPILIKQELEKILVTEKRSEMLRDYGVLKEKLGGAGASEKTAKAVLKTLESKL